MDQVTIRIQSVMIEEPVFPESARPGVQLHQGETDERSVVTLRPVDCPINSVFGGCVPKADFRFELLRGFIRGTTPAYPKWAAASEHP